MGGAHRGAGAGSALPLEPSGSSGQPSCRGNEGGEGAPAGPPSAMLAGMYVCIKCHTHMAGLPPPRTGLYPLGMCYTCRRFEEKCRTDIARQILVERRKDRKREEKYREQIDFARQLRLGAVPDVWAVAPDVPRGTKRSR